MRKELRYKKILEILKHKDEISGFTIDQLHSKLCPEYFIAHKRTIRRYLEELSSSHGISSSETRPERYFLSKDYSFKHSLQLDESSIQVLLIALNNLAYSSHHFFYKECLEIQEVIANSLDSSTVKTLKTLNQQFHFDYSLVGKPSSNDQKNFSSILKALRTKKSFHCHNNSPYDDSNSTKQRHFFPMTFIISGNIPYLIVKDLNDGLYKNLRVTRLSDVKISNQLIEENIIPVELESFIGGWLPDSPLVDIKITCDEAMANYFQEKIIHKSQKTKKLTKYKYLITLKCHIGYNLERKIAGFGSSIIDIKPDSLKESIISIYENGLKNLQ